MIDNLTVELLMQLFGIKWDPRVYSRQGDVHKEFVDQMEAYAKSRPVYSYEHDGVHYEVFNP